MGNKPKNIAGQRFGRLVAVCPTDRRKGGSVVWECRCDCGKTAYYSAVFLRSKAISCGCLKTENNNQKAKNIAGMTFHKLTALEATNQRDSDGSIIWKWKCDCGTVTEKSLNSVSRGLTKSCGCLHRENGRKHYQTILRPSYVVGTNLNLIKTETGKAYKNNSTGIRGVYFLPKENVYGAGISFQGVRIYKRYTTLEDAVMARRRMQVVHEEFVEWWDSLSSEEKNQACLDYECEKEGQIILLKKRIREYL